MVPSSSGESVLVFAFHHLRKGRAGGQLSLREGRGDGSELSLDSLFVLLDENVEDLTLDESEFRFWILWCVVVESFVDSEHG
jgi:hypothetical protein